MTNELVSSRERPMINPEDVNPISMMFDPVIAERVVAVAQSMAKGHVTVPEHLRGNVGDCLAIVMQAASWRLNPYAVAQKTHLVRGLLGYEAQLVNAVATSLGIIDGRFCYEPIGDWSKLAKPPKMQTINGRTVPAPGWQEKDEEGLGLIVKAKIKGETEPFEMPIYLAQAYPRNSTLWATDPFQQLCYLGVKRFMRRYAPDAILGVYTPDELQERVIDAEVVVDKPAASDTAAAINAMAQKANVDTAQAENGADLDAHGIPWNPDFHFRSRATLADGTWRMKRGYDPDAYAKWITEYKDELFEKVIPNDDGASNQGAPSMLFQDLRRALVEITESDNPDLHCVPALNDLIDEFRSSRDWYSSEEDAEIQGLIGKANAAIRGES